MFSEEMIINFDPPLEFNGKTLDAISLREPTVSQVEQADKATGGSLHQANMRAFQVTLLAATAGVSEQFIRQMRISDLSKGFDFLMGFISGGPQTSKKSKS